jgi:hypothetical protein
MELLIEIKAPNKDDHQKAVDGLVPTKYIPQLQHNMAVAGFAAADYVSYHEADPEKIRIVRVALDKEYGKLLLDQEAAFWDRVVKKLAPEMTESDLVAVEDPLFERFRQAKAEVDRVVARADALNEEIKAKYPAGGVTCAGYQLVMTSGRSSIDYASIPELQGVSLEKYKKAGKPSLTLRPLKKT